MAEQKLCNSELHTQLVLGIKQDIESLKSSIDTILNDMNGIRTARLEILDRVNSLKNDNAISNEQIQVTLGKAKRMLRKYEENRRRLEIVLKKMSEFNHSHAEAAAHPVRITSETESNKVLYSILSGKGRIHLQLLDSKNYLMSKEKNCDEWSRNPKDKECKESILKELQWIVKMKLYKLRHHYERLPGDNVLKDKTSLVLPVRRNSEHA